MPMLRALALSTLMLAATALPAPAIEMFTNFDNGQNIGFPPQQVPTSVYGRGGWNARSLSRDRVPSGLPAMIPSGQRPHFTGCNNCSNVWNGYRQHRFGDHVHASPISPLGVPQDMPQPAGQPGRDPSGDFRPATTDTVQPDIAPARSAPGSGR